MEDLIKALQIFSKYANGDRNPTNCTHDKLSIFAGIDEGMVSESDMAELNRLGFFWSDSDYCFISYRFGSC